MSNCTLPSMREGHGTQTQIAGRNVWDVIFLTRCAMHAQLLRRQNSAGGHRVWMFQVVQPSYDESEDTWQFLKYNLLWISQLHIWLHICDMYVPSCQCKKCQLNLNRSALVHSLFFRCLNMCCYCGHSCNPPNIWRLTWHLPPNNPCCHLSRGAPSS